MNDSYNGRDLFVIDIDGQRSDPLTPRPPELQKKIDLLRQQLFGRSGPVLAPGPKAPPAGQPSERKDS
jgi:hypothetical protein